jgi:hypothetical protein
MGLPGVVFWAWERPEDLRFVDPHKQGVAFLARTIELRSLAPGENEVTSPGVVLKPRLQPLALPAGASLMAVVRIETSNDLWHRPRRQIQSGSDPAKPPYTETQRHLVATMATDAARLSGVKALQIDFDASQSERAFYAALLEDMRRRLPRGMPLSITALASWCIGDHWLDRLSPGTVDEAVPMLFRMGPDGESIASYLKSGNEFRSPLCRASLGVSTDESLSQALLSGSIGQDSVGWRSRRLYVFSPRAWTKQDANKVSAELEKWHKE